MAPPCGCVAASTRPSCERITRSTMARPRPVPPGAASGPRWKGSNSESRSLVTDRQRRTGAGLNPHVAAAMQNRVLDQVRQGQFDRGRIGPRGRAVRIGDQFQLCAVGVGKRRQLCDRRPRHVGEIDGAAPRQGHVGRSGRQQLLDRAGETQQVTTQRLGGRAGWQAIQSGEQHRQRGAQRMGSFGGAPPFGRQRRLQAIQRAFQRVDQLLQLLRNRVPRWGWRVAGAGLQRTRPGRCRCHRLQGPPQQRGVAAQQQQNHGDHRQGNMADEFIDQRPQFPMCRIPRHGDHHVDLRSAMGCGEHRESQCAAVLRLFEIQRAQRRCEARQIREPAPILAVDDRALRIDDGVGIVLRVSPEVRPPRRWHLQLGVEGGVQGPRLALQGRAGQFGGHADIADSDGDQIDGSCRKRDDRQPARQHAGQRVGASRHEVPGGSRTGASIQPTPRMVTTVSGAPAPSSTLRNLDTAASSALGPTSSSKL